MKLNTMHLLAAVLILAGLASPASACGNQSDTKRPLLLVAADAERLLNTRDFAQLDQRIAAARKPGSHTSDGQAMLTGLYAGLTDIDGDCTASLDTAAWDQRRALLHKWKTVSRDPSAPGIALAMLDASQGWRARGGGYASTVTEEGWRHFHKGMASSRKQLEKLSKFATIDPQWHQAMLNVATNQGWDSAQFDAQFSKATAAFPNHLSYYFSKGVYYGPKWHGSRAQFGAFVEEAVRATEPTMGQTMYARLHWSQSSDTMFTDGQTDWQRMKAGFETMLKDFPDAWNRNNFARFACIANDQKTASAQFALLGANYIHEVWKAHAFFEACRQRASRDVPPQRN